jgi:hypothetical protein
MLSLAGGRTPVVAFPAWIFSLHGGFGAGRFLWRFDLVYGYCRACAARRRTCGLLGLILIAVYVDEGTGGIPKMSTHHVGGERHSVARTVDSDPVGLQLVSF